MDTFDFITPFYNENHNQDSLVERVDSLISNENIDVRSIPFTSKFSPTEIFNSFYGNSRNVILIKENHGAPLFKLTYSYNQKGKKYKGEGKFFILEAPGFNNVYIAITIESGDFFNKILLPFFQRLHPNATMTFIKHEKLLLLINNFKNMNNLDELIITRASCRVRRGEEKLFPIISWPRMNLKEAFDWVYQNDGFFQSLQFEAKKRNNLYSNVYLSRQGVVKTNSHYLQVYKYFIFPLCKIISDNIKLFSNRSRRDNNQLIPKPLIIDFKSNLFTNTTDNITFIKSIKTLSNSSVSTYHGNPYINMSIVDYFDGSTFDLWVLNTNKLILVPQMKATIPSIKRIISHIFDNFAEGNIIDYDETSL